MKKERARGSFLAQLLVVALILVPIIGLVVPVVRDARGPRGDPVPTQPPDETNRIHHPLGFSIVVPPCWDHRIGFDGGPLMLAPQTPGPDARRSRALIVVTPLGRHRPQDLGSLQPTSFDGHPALEGMRVVRPWSFDDGAWSEYSLYLKRAGVWYEVRYGIAAEQTHLPSAVRRYLETLRWDGES